MERNANPLTIVFYKIKTMKIKTATITGADNNTNIRDMLQISNQYPFVEWGILFSPKRIGEERYPDINWINKLSRNFSYDKIHLSAHLCGGYTREMLLGKSDLIDVPDMKDFLSLCGRMQLNFNSQKSKVDEKKFFGLLKGVIGGRIIFQYNLSNVRICINAMEELTNISFLYDSSGGRGIIKEKWQKPFMGFFTGYAGGLSPDNLKEELKKIEGVVGDREIWIDTETHVRTNGILDMNKVKLFLEIASKYI